MKRVLRLLSLVLRWLLLLSLLPISTCSPKLTLLARIRTAGTLVVAATNSPTTCYEGPRGMVGYECDLLKGLADKLGVKLELQFVDSAAEAVAAVLAGRADLGAGGIAVTPDLQQQVRLSRPIQRVVQQLVYRNGSGAPASLAELDGSLSVVAGSGGEARLSELKQRYPGLAWTQAGEDDDAEDLLYKVAKGKLDYTVASSDLVAVDRRFYPQLQAAFAVSDSQDLAWALANGDDSSLFRAVQSYLNLGLGESGLARLREAYFGPIGATDYLGVVRFTSDVQTRLPRFRPLFEDAAKKYGLDWRVLACVGYEESRWDPAAISPTGVRGIMMLTTETAAQMAVDRENPAQSIRGGARYLSGLLGQLPPQIGEPDRTWMALAAYNQGIGHLLDARGVAAQLGGDPDRWFDVRNALPLLSREAWFKRLHYGYAAGRATVGYVDDVRSYYEMLTWMTDNQNAAPGPKEEVSEADLKSLAAPPPGRGPGAPR